jgi:protein-ribulosamine 3-kinase
MAPGRARLATEVFRKAGGDAAMYAAEFEGLQALRAAGVRAPEPYLHGDAFIEMERLDLGARPDWPALARMLAKLHRHAAPRFGWATDNWIGLAPQRNGWRDDWVEFFREFRLRPQCERAGLALPNLDYGKLFEGHKPSPSLLHGDLWRGNVGFTAQGPVLFDPAVYYGDREADLAMSELFGGFPQPFYAAYNAEYPLEGGYSVRKHLYNLYHLLNHLNLFGPGYRAQVERTLGFLRDAFQ